MEPFVLQPQKYGAGGSASFLGERSVQRTVVEVCTYRLSSLRGERPDNLRATKPVLWTRPIRGQQRVLQSSAHALLTPRNRFPTTLRSTASSALHIDAILSLSFLSLLDWTLINYPGQTASAPSARVPFWPLQSRLEAVARSRDPIVGLFLPPLPLRSLAT